jgi:hypothetical protein
MPTPTLDDIDTLCAAIQVAIPEATMVTVNRVLIQGQYSFDTSVAVPARDKRFRIMPGKMVTLRTLGEDTLDGLLDKTIGRYRYHLTGKL